MNIEDTIKKLRMERRIRELTQNQVGNKIGVDGDLLRSYENYRTQPRFDTLVAWAGALDYEIVMKPKEKK